MMPRKLSLFTYTHSFGLLTSAVIFNSSNTTAPIFWVNLWMKVTLLMHPHSCITKWATIVILLWCSQLRRNVRPAADGRHRPIDDLPAVHRQGSRHLGRRNLSRRIRFAVETDPSRWRERRTEGNTDVCFIMLLEVEVGIHFVDKK